MNGLDRATCEAQAFKDRQKEVRKLFDRVAPYYDLMNDLMSLGSHRCWKDALLCRLRPRDGERILDLAGGTGDIALRIRRQSSANVLVIDNSLDMLQRGRHRALDQGIIRGICWSIGDAEDIPCRDAQYDACVISFGLRNVIQPQQVLTEIYRILKPGGRFICLEFSHTIIPGLKQLYRAYSHILPKLGALVARDEASYRYLVDSIKKFPHREQLACMMQQAGFAHVTHDGLTGGIVALHQGWRY